MTVRPARPDDMSSVYMLGYDVWGEADQVSYLAECRESPKYKQGLWYVLEHDGKLKSALICYKNRFGLPADTAGIGSVATSPSDRRQGHAARLITGVIDIFKNEGISSVFLFSDIAPELYAKIGFRALPEVLQKYSPAICMKLNIGGKKNDANPVLSYF